MWIGKLFLMVAAGMLGASTVPHFVKGITGQRHQTPFGKPSSAVLNVLWGSANLMGALWLGVWAASYGVGFGAGGSLAILGALIAGLPVAAAWAKDPLARGETPA